MYGHNNYEASIGNMTNKKIVKRISYPQAVLSLPRIVNSRNQILVAIYLWLTLEPTFKTSNYNL